MAGATQILFQKCFFLTCDFRLLLLLMKILHSATFADAQQSVTWYQLDPSLDTSNGSLVSAEIGPKQSEFVTCVWTRISYFRRPSIPLSVGSRQTSIGDVSIGMVPTGIFLRQGRSVWAAAATISPLSWYHICLTLTPTMVSVILDGRPLLNVNSVTDYLRGNILIRLGGSLKWPEVTPSTFDLTSPTEQSWDNLADQGSMNKVVGAFAGDLVDPNVWGIILLDRDIKKLSECKNIPITTLRDLSSWQMAGSNINQDSIDSTMPCQGKQFDYLLFREPMKYAENLELCVRMDMEMIRPTEQDRILLNEDALKYKDICGDGERTVWLSTDDHNCFVLKNSKREVAPCTAILCGGCQFKAGDKRLFILRGLCPLPDSDFAFVAAPDFNSGPYFKGVERYNINKKDIDVWELTDITDNKVLASTTGKDPVGTRTWKLAPQTCGNNAEIEVNASMSACQLEQGACSNGACVPVSSRCDGYPHCSDGSDEETCEIVRTPPTYMSNAPPPNPPVEVIVRIEISRVVSTEPLLLLLNTHLTWEDPRLMFSNLRKGNDHSVPLSANMWKPQLIVLAHRSTAPVDMVLQSDEYSDGRRSSASLTANTKAMPVKDMRETASFDTIYPGTNTTLTLSEYVLRPIDCYFDFSFFPFDVHECELSMVLAPNGKEHARLSLASNGARYTGRTRLKDFCFDEVKMKIEDSIIGGREHSGVLLTLRLSRRSSYIIVSVILPSLLLLCISTASLWMSFPSKTSSRLIVNCWVTGAFLGLWLISTFNSPATGKVKALDVWLCFCTIHSILHALLHVFLDIFGKDEPQPLFSRTMSRAPSRMREVKPVESGSIYDNLMRVPETEENWTVAYWITFIARVVSPALVVLFNAAFWPFVVYFSKNPLP